MNATKKIAQFLGSAVLSLSLLSGALPSTAHAERVKDLASVLGVRANQLIGYGLVVGLDGTGDRTSQAPFALQSLRNFLNQMGVTVPGNLRPQTDNIAAVSVHAELPPFAKPGQTIDITVSSLGNAESLRGGSLLMTPLKGANGQVYAIAQGNLSVGGLGVSGQDGSSVTVNVPSVGRIPNGATVEREVPSSFYDQPQIVLNLHRPDFTTAHRMTETINEMMGGGIAVTMDATSVMVSGPFEPAQRVGFLSILENIEIEPGSGPARVVVNARTGTVVIGSEVTVQPAAVSHGSLLVTITESDLVSQPGPFARRGRTAIVDESDVAVEQDANPMFLFGPGVTLSEIVEAVNEVGASPSDLVAILESLREVGALRAQLIII